MAAEKKERNKPLVLRTRTIFFDCCDTLVLYDFPPDYPDEIAVLKYETVEHGHTKRFRKRMAVNTAAVEKLKQHKDSGDSVIVWSAGGWEWAKGIIESLGLEDYVDVIMDKPALLYDDLFPYDKDRSVGFLPTPVLPLPEGWDQESTGKSVNFTAKCMKNKTCERCKKGNYKHFRTELNLPNKLYCPECNYTIDKWRK